MIPHGENVGKGCNNGQRFVRGTEQILILGPVSLINSDLWTVWLQDLHFRANDGNGALNRHGNKKDAMQRTYNALR